MSDSDSNDNRRNSTRHLACFAAHVAPEGGKPRTALIRDLSVTGARLLTRAKLEVGDPIRLELFLTSDATVPHAAVGKVVRSEKIDDSGLWSRAVAVQFDEPLETLEPDIKAMAEQQARVAGRNKTS